MDQLAVPEATPTGMAGFHLSVSPVEWFVRPAARRWETAYNTYQPQVGNNFPLELEGTLGSELRDMGWPEIEMPPDALHRADSAGVPLPKITAPAAGLPAMLGGSVPEAGLLRHLEIAPESGETTRTPSLAPNAGWAAPEVAMAAGAAIPALTPGCWESCATIAPEPAERWLSLVVATEPLFEPQALRAPRFDLPTETPECLRDIGKNPPKPVEAWMRSPAPQPAERWIETAVAGTLAAIPALRMQSFEMDAQGDDILRDPGVAPPPVCEQAAASPAAEPVEHWLRTSSAEAVAFGTAAIAIPQPQAALPACAPALAGAATAPLAEAVERWIEPAMASGFALTAQTIQNLPFALRAHGAEIFRDPADAPPLMAEEWAPMPAAEAVERWLEPAMATGFAVGAQTIRNLPFTMRAHGAEILRDPADAPPPMAGEWAPMPAAEAAERWIEPAMATEFVRTEKTIHTLPFAVVSDVPSALRDPGEVPPGVAAFMPVPAAEPVERWLAAAMANEIAPALSIATPAFPLSVASPFIPFSARFARPNPAEPVATFVRPTFRLIPMRLDPAFPPMPLRVGQSVQGGSEHSGLAGAANGPEAAPVESMPAAGKAPIPFRRAPALPDTPAAPTRVRLAPADVTEIYPAAARAAEGIPASIPLKPLETVKTQAPAIEIERPMPCVPQPGLFQLDYYCQRGTGSPSPRTVWSAPQIPAAALRFQMKPVFESFGEEEPPKPVRKGPAIAEIFTLPEARPKGSQWGNLGWVGKIAAGIMVMFALWSGSKLADLGRRPDAVARETAAPQRSEEPRPLVARGGEPQKGAMAKFRQAIAERAAVTVGDTFHGGMESWGSAAKSWAPGWTHSPDGYVRVGDLALFKPTQSFRDYRLEFYGQIEKKSMGWVMRATDKQNYYAMKFTVVEPGLRPVIAMVHYPVVGGKKGHKVETPLSVMFHNNTPYHVTVDVKGNRFTASIEGERVDSWTDDTPGAGAVGFFSEAGEAARLYWAKVSKNQDFIGRFCSYLAGDGANRTAEIWNPQLPPAPQAPADPRPHDFVLAAAFESESQEHLAPRGASKVKNWRIPTWIS